MTRLQVHHLLRSPRRIMSPRSPFRRLRPASAALGLTLFTLLSAAPAHAQSDEQAVIAVVNHFFDGMRTRDTALLRSTVVPTTTLVTASGPTGLGTPGSIDGFIERVGKGTGPGGDERIQNPKVQIDSPMASLWAYFTYTRGGETQINHCGVDLFLLRKGPDGWKIFDIADTHRTEGCTAIPK
jgi:hypothetical protein